MQTYIRELLRCLPEAASPAALLARVQADARGELPPRVVADARPPSAGVRRALQGLAGYPGADLVHGLDVDLPVGGHARTVCTVHDLSVFDVPWAFGRVRATGERALVAASVRRADRLIAVSAFTAERIAARLGREAVVTWLAPSPDMVPPVDGAHSSLRTRYPDLPKRFVLQVATVEPRKGADRLAAACRRVGLPLVLAGGVAPGMRVPDGAHHLGYVDRALLPALYVAAEVVAYLSDYEGFGLPPVEAAACGAPVVASPVGALSEVLGDGAMFVPRGDDDALERALRELWHDHERRKELAGRGSQRAGQLSWSRTAAQTAAVYRSLGLAI